MPVTNYYCSVDHEHRLTPCVHGRCKEVGYMKIDWRKGVRALFKWGDNPVRELTEDDGA